MYEVKSNVCEKCSSNKDIIVLMKDTEQKCLCMKCFDTQLLYDGWKNENFEICQECVCIINCLKENIYVLTKNDEDKIWWCECLNELWCDAYNDGWRGDDIEQEVEYHEKYF
jgi:hypothetical protein